MTKTNRQGQPLGEEKYSPSHLPGFENIPQDMQDALVKFYLEGEQIVHTFLSTLEQQEPPPILYHYTNDIGLRGILETGRLWLTDIFDLNDPSELSHGFSLAINTLNSMIATGHPVGKKFADNFALFAQQGALPRTAHFFLCSFSSIGDDLGQWRAYADNGRGYALGFDAKALERMFTKNNGEPIPNNSTFWVRYSDGQLVDLQRQLIQKMTDLLLLPRGRNLGDSNITVYMLELQMLLTLHILQLGIFFKHEAYANEKEFRFLQIFKADEPPSMKLRPRRYSLVKYREFNWKDVADHALNRIVIGPAADRSKNLAFANDCLNHLDLHNVAIDYSQIPYRAM